MKRLRSYQCCQQDRNVSLASALAVKVKDCRTCELNSSVEIVVCPVKALIERVGMLLIRLLVLQSWKKTCSSCSGICRESANAHGLVAAHLDFLQEFLRCRGMHLTYIFNLHYGHLPSTLVLSLNFSSACSLSRCGCIEAICRWSLVLSWNRRLQS